MQEWNLLHPDQCATFVRATAFHCRLDSVSKTVAAQDYQHGAQHENETVSDFIRRYNAYSVLPTVAIQYLLKLETLSYTANYRRTAISTHARTSCGNSLRKLMHPGTGSHPFTETSSPETQPCCLRQQGAQSSTEVLQCKTLAGLGNYPLPLLPLRW